MGGAGGTDDMDDTDGKHRNGGHRVHIGSFTSAGGRGITTADVDPATGALTLLSTSDAVADPSYLALDRGTGVLYAVSETQQGAVVAFRPTREGLAALGPAVRVGGAGPTHLSVAGRRLLTANYTSGSVSSLPLSEDGILCGPASVLDHRGSGPDASRQERPHAHQVLPDPSGRWVLSVDLGTDSVRVCASDPATGALRLHDETALRAGTGPRHLSFHPDGETVYVLHELEPQLTVCRWNPGSGQLEPTDEVPLAPGAAPGAARAYPSAVVASRTAVSCGRPYAAPTPSSPSRSPEGPGSRGSWAAWNAAAAGRGTSPPILRGAVCTRPTSAPGTSPGSTSTR